MTTFNTGNPVGSVDPRDLYDNAENLDNLVNHPTKTEFQDRLGVPRKTWHGMEQGFQQFLVSSGYTGTGAGGAYEDYDADGPLTITALNQIFIKDGEFYRLKPNQAMPYTTTDWVTDEVNMVAVGDAALRSELSQADGASLIGHRGQSVRQVLDQQEYYITPELFGAVGDGVSDDTAPLNAAIATGGVVFLKKGKRYLYKGVETSVIGVSIAGCGEITGVGQVPFILDGGDVLLKDATFSNFETLFLKDTTSSGVVIGDIKEVDVKYDNVVHAFWVYGSGGFNSFTSVRTKATNFSRLYRLTAWYYTLVQVYQGDFDGVPGWDGTAVTHDGQRFVAWVGDRDSTDPDPGRVIISGNTVRNVVADEHRADGFLVQYGASFHASGNDLVNIAPWHDVFLSQGYLDYTDGIGGENGGSGLYSNISNTTFVGNTLLDAGVGCMVCTVVDSFHASHNIISGSGLWTDRGAYLRATTGSFLNNTVRNMPRPVYRNNPDSVTFRDFDVGENIISDVLAGVAIEYEGARRNEACYGNKISNVTNTHPTSFTDRCAGILFNGQGGTNVSCEIHDNRVTTITDTLSITDVAAVLLRANTGVTMGRFDISRNIMKGSSVPTVGFRGEHSGHYVDGNINDTSASAVERFGTTPMSLKLGLNQNAAGAIVGRAQTTAVVASGSTSQSVSGIGVLGNSVTLTNEAVRVQARGTLGSASSHWTTGFSQTGATVNVNAAPGVSVTFDVWVDFTGKTVSLT